MSLFEAAEVHEALFRSASASVDGETIIGIERKATNFERFVNIQDMCYRL